MKSILAILFIVAALPCRAQYHTNTITTPDGVFAFSVDGSAADNPTIELQAGVTNILDIQTVDFHPVVITSTPDTFDWFGGADPQNVFDQPMALSTPASGFPTTLYYMCYFHGFYGEIHLSAPISPIPPQNLILSIRVGTNVTMFSTGTNTTWMVVPEYRSNLVSGNWTAVPSYTNSYSNGTNTTVFDRLDPICGPNVFLRLRQQPN